jgi:dipeptidase
MFVPAADYPDGSLRAVYYDYVSLGFKAEWGGTMTQRYVGSDRGPDYVDADVPQSVPIGYIPQVAHTYAYIDGNYGIINEKQLAIGECTDEEKVTSQPAANKRLFYSSELSRVALERCETARDAVLLMGELITTYGYYGTAETLLVADPDEGWVMEMCAYEEDGATGVWVAKKVPDGEVFVAANALRIRTIDPNDPDILYSANVFEVAQEKGWWDPAKEPLMDWAKTFGTGEGLHPYATLRREWRILSRLSPSANFSPWVKNTFSTAYPFSVKPDAKLSVADVMALHRDHYEGTDFDLTKTPAGGPFGSPQRWRGTYDYTVPWSDLKGAWERPISIFFCAFVYVNQLRTSLPDPIGGVCWLGLDEPYNCCFIPLYAGSTNIPQAFKTSDQLQFEWGASLWWAFNFVNNWSELKYSYMIKDIQSEQTRIETEFINGRAALEAEAQTLYETDPSAAIAYLTADGQASADTVSTAWWALAATLIAKYADGYINTSAGMAQKVGYPAWWRKQNGYKYGPRTYAKRKPWGAKQVEDNSLEAGPAPDQPATDAAVLDQPRSRAGNLLRGP